MNKTQMGAVTLLVFFVFFGLLYSDHPNTLAQNLGGNGADIAWMLTATALVMLMTPGLSLFYGGLVRTKNVVSTLFQSFVALAVISLVWVFVGFSLAFGESVGGLVGSPLTFFMLRDVTSAPHPDLSPTIPLSLFALFQLKFAIITPALITGAFAERVRFKAYLAFMVLFTLVIYCPLAHMTWHPDGILRQLGVLDFAGGTVVHVSAGVAALAGARYLGPRRDGEGHGPADIPLVVLGTGMLWFGWFGFNAGSALEANAVAISAFWVTNMASASAMVTWLLCDVLRGQKPSVVGACIGAVVGLVAITPAAGFVGLGASLTIGAVAAMVSNIAVHLTSRSGVDDTLDVFPCHGVGGMVGMLLTAVFAPEGKTITHVIVLFSVVAIVNLVAYALYWIVDRIIQLRVCEADELAGLDLSQHGERVRATDLGHSPARAQSSASH